MQLAFLRSDVRDRVAEKISHGNFDDAIKDAAAYLEVRLQALGTKNINTKLVEDLFTTGRLRISESDDRNLGAQHLFDAAFRLVRNDRGHDKSPVIQIEIPCHTEESCLRYLGYICLLLDLLERNLVDRPQIFSHQINAQIIISGKNFSPSMKVTINGETVQPLGVKSDDIILELPSQQSGIIALEHPIFGSTSIQYQLPPKTHTNYFKVEATKIPLFTDIDATQQRDGIFGVLTTVYEDGKQYPRITPSSSNYTVGDYVTHEYQGPSIGESWFKDPTDHLVKYAWSSSLQLCGSIIGRAGTLRPISVSIRPENITGKPEEKRLIRAIAVFTDDVRFEEVDVTKQCTWSIDNEHIAHINNVGVLRLHQIGNAVVRCSYQNLHDSARVAVITPVSGQIVKYFFGAIRRYQAIRFDEHNALYIANQHDTIIKIGDSIDTVVKIPILPDPKYGFGVMPPHIDNVAIGNDGSLYVTCLTPRRVYRLKDDRLHTVLENDKPLSAIDIDSLGNIFIAGWDKGFYKIAKGGAITLYPTEYHAICLRVIDDSRVIIGSAGGGDILGIYSTDNGALLRSIDSPLIKSPDDFAVSNGVVYVGCFGGAIFRLDLQGDAHEIVAQLDGVGSIDCDSNGDLYAAVFDSKDRDNVGIYKIYLS